MDPPMHAVADSADAAAAVPRLFFAAAAVAAVGAVCVAAGLVCRCLRTGTFTNF